MVATSQDSTPSRLRRRLFKAAACLLGAAVLLPIATWLTLQSPGARRALIGWSGRALERTTGIEAAAADFSLALRTARLELSGLELAAAGSGEHPFLVVERVVVDSSWADVLFQPRRLHSVTVEGPALDLSAPLPAGEGTPVEESADSGETNRVDIGLLSISDGRLWGPLVPTESTIWADTWRAEDLDLQGTVAGGAIVVDRTTARLIVESTRRPDIAADLSGSASMHEGSLAIRDLELVSDRLRLEAAGSGPLDRTAGFAIEYALDARLGELFPDLGVGGQARSDGTLTLDLTEKGGIGGNATLDVTDFPAVLLEPWLESLRQGDLDPAGTTLDVRGSFGGTLSFGEATTLSEDQLTGDLDVVWRRGDERLLSADFGIAEPEAPGGLRLAVEAALLPDSPGTRRLRGILAAANWSNLPLGGRLEDTSLRLDLPSLTALWSKLGLSPAGLDGWLPAGALAAEATAVGPLERPEIAIGGRWSVEGEEVARIGLTGRPGLLPELDSGLDVALTLDLLPKQQGTRELEAEISIPDWARPADSVARSSTLRLDLPDISAFAARLLDRLPLALPYRYSEGPDLDRLRDLSTEFLTGSLVSRVEARGPVVSPEVEAEGVWRPAPDQVVSWWATGEALQAAPYFRPSEPAWFEVSGLDLARFESLLPAGEESEVRPRPPLEGRLSGKISAAALGPGPAVTLEVQTEGAWHLAPDQVVSWWARGETLSVSPYFRPSEPMRLEVSGLDLERFEGFLVDGGEGEVQPWRPVEGRLSGRVSVAALGPESAADLEVETTDLVLGDLGRSSELRLRATVVGSLLSLVELHAEFEPSYPARDSPAILDASGWLEVAKPLTRGIVTSEIDRPAPGVDAIVANAALKDGYLSVDVSAGKLGRLSAALPLAVASGMVGTLDGFLPSPEEGLVELTADALDLGLWQDLAEILTGRQESLVRADGMANGFLVFDPSRPITASGRFSLTELGLHVGDDRIVVDKGLEIVARGGTLEVPETRWRVKGELTEAPVAFSARVELSPDWSSGNPIPDVVTRIDAGLQSTLDASILTPFLSGGLAGGTLMVEAEASGDLSDLTARLRLDGPYARILFPISYPTLIEAPEIAAEVRNGAWRLEKGRFKLNGGEVELALVDLDAGGVRLDALVRGARYRLDHGLIAELAGDLSLTLPAEGRRRLSGQVTLERGALRRDLILEQEILRLAGQQSFDGAEASVFSEIDLDLDILTLDGIWIRNNLANLHLDWSLLRARGTMANPYLAGRIDVDSGGILTAYGQTVRIDEGALILSGDPDIAPRLELETTSSLEDPRLQQNQGNFWAAGMGEQGPGMGGLWDSWYGQGNSTARVGDVASGLTSYYGNMFAEGLASGLDRVQLSFQPLPVIGETDNQARLTIAYNASEQVTLYSSQNPRQAEGRTEILDLSGFAIRPSLRAQVFNNDQNLSGMTLQEVMLFGGGERRDDTPRLRKIRVDLPTSKARRRVRRSLDFQKGDPFPEVSLLHVEVDAIEGLRRRGFPSASVDVATEPASKQRIDLEIGVIPGTAVQYEFDGEKLPRRVRRTVRAMYQPEAVDRGASLREMRAQIVRALRARGHLHPEVEITIEPTDEADLTTVRIVSRGGPVVDPDLPRFPDLGLEEASELAGRFESRLARVELAADQPGARAFLSRALRGMGFSQASIQSIVLDEASEDLVVNLDPGPRDRIASVEVVGMRQEDAAPILTALGVVPGQPLRSGRLTRATLSLEDQLRDMGHLEAAVGVTSESVKSEVRGDGKNGERAIVFQAEAGPVSTVGEITIEGIRASRPDWVRRKLLLTDGEVLTPSDLQVARRNLSRTGEFSRIGLSPEDAPAEGGKRAIVLDLEERPRYLVGVGARWQEESGLGIVVDAVDRHFLGLGQTFGIRAFYSQEDKRLRFFHAMPLPRSRTLEFFLEARKENDPALKNLETDAIEFWTQYSFPLTARSTSRVYGVARRRKFRLEGLDDGLIPKEDNTPLVGWQVLFDSPGGEREGRPKKKWGLFYGHDLVGFTQALGGEADGLGLFTQLKLDLPVLSIGRKPETARSLTWVQSYRLGWLEAFEGELPLVDRLRAGGEFSVRGYPRDSLGPVSPDGVPLGGEFMVIVNQELQMLLIPRLAGIAFFDAGNVWLNRSTLDSTLFKSVGVGLRYASPVGPLRLDWAFPLDRREGDPSYKVYLGFGPTF